MGIIFDCNHFAYEQQKIKTYSVEEQKEKIKRTLKKIQKNKNSQIKLTAEERQRLLGCCGGRK